MSDLKRIHAVISGRVQGVGFRYYTEKRALELGLKGQVRNSGSGKVEVIAEGSEEKLKILIDHLQRGPALSHVTGIDVQWSQAHGNFDDFSVTY
jgi:acylphosphatase